MRRAGHQFGVELVLIPKRGLVFITFEVGDVVPRLNGIHGLK